MLIKIQLFLDKTLKQADEFKSKRLVSLNNLSAEELEEFKNES